jgi:putative Holliday junction resolvase
MRILALDIGSKTVGMAMTDATQTIARAVDTLRYHVSKTDQIIAQLVTFIAQENVGEVVIGLPRYTFTGQVSEHGTFVVEYKKKLEALEMIPVVLYDEWYTTKLAAQPMIDANLSREKRKQVIDQQAAVILLQDYLIFRQGRTTHGR